MDSEDGLSQVRQTLNRRQENQHMLLERGNAKNTKALRLRDRSNGGSLTSHRNSKTET